MAMDAYDQLAHAAQAAYAEKEVSEDVRQEKIRAAFERAGYAKEWKALTTPPRQKRHGGEE